MNVTNAKIIISAVKKDQFPEDALPEIALAGRSNVGKSSLINTLINRKNLARTSQRPGKTQTINFYLINELLYFADVPGYGFAKVPKSVRASWKKMIEGYLKNRAPLKAVIQILDLRHPPTSEDKSMYHFLRQYGIPVIIVVTKADKIAKGKWLTYIKVIREALRAEGNEKFILFSSKTGQGKEEVWKEIQHHISE